MGRSTLYYFHTEGLTILCTSFHWIIGLLESLELDDELAAQFLYGSRSHSSDFSATLIKGIKRIPPGSLTSLTRDEFQINRVWVPHDPLDVNTRELPDAAIHTEEILNEQLDSILQTEKVGCLISGGLDSSLIASMASRVCKKKRIPFHGITIGHNVDSHEERNARQKLSEWAGIEIITPPFRKKEIDVQELERLNRNSEAPAGGLFGSHYTELLTWSTEQDYSVLLTGEGGDEVFGAKPVVILDLLKLGKPHYALDAAAYFAADVYKTSAFRVFAEVLRGQIPSKDMAFLRTFLGADYAKALLKSIRETTIRIRSEDAAVGFLVHGEVYREVLEIEYFIPDANQSGCHLSNPLAKEAVLHAASSLRLDASVGCWRGFESKPLLRAVAQKYLPPAFLSMPKHGVYTLLLEVGETHANEMMEYIRSTVPHLGLGIDLDERLSDFRAVPVKYSLYWILLFLLCIWWNEVRSSWRDRHNG